MAHLKFPWQSVLNQKISARFHEVKNLQFHAVGGGSINETYRIDFSNKTVFCKVNSASEFPHLLKKEKAGLELIAKQNIIRTPCIIDCFEYQDYQVLLMEWIQEGEKTDTFWKMFGKQLAELHLVSSVAFGLDEDNYMGSVKQQNDQCKSWKEFFIAKRLTPLIIQCTDKGLLTSTHKKQFDQLMKKVHTIFNEEPPSLVHGDLWSGNFMCNEAGEPVLIDPAVYYGHRSMDLAMTTLFGGFKQSFYEAYDYHFPFPSNYKEQWSICNLYPLLIHLYLFGSSYLPQIERTILHYQ